MEILDYLATIPGLTGAYLSVQPDKPDACITLRQYAASPPVHSFSGIDDIYNVQAIARDTTAAGAYALAVAVSGILGRYADGAISSIRSTPILDIGVDDANPPRHEYTINFEIRRL